MDTKWKKSKAVLYVISYAAGVSLLIAAVMFNPYFAFHSNLRDMRVILSEDGSYVQTEAFRNYISRMLNSLIRVGAGQPLSYGTAVEYGGAWSLESVTDFWNLRNKSGWVRSEAVAEGTATAIDEIQEYYVTEAIGQAETASEVTEGDSVWLEEDDGLPQAWSLWNEAPEALDDEEIAQQRNRFLYNLSEDKNLLYEVVCVDSKGKPVTYRNAEQVDMGADPKSLLEQYSFVLKFDGERAQAWLEGEPLDLYGDGVYSWEDSAWTIPGYENYKLPEDWSSGQIAIAVRRVPMLYTVGDQTYGAGLYWIYRNLLEEQHFFRVWIGLLTGAAAAGALCICLRGSRQSARKKMGSVLGRIPLEAAIAAAAVIVGAGCALYMDEIYWGWSADWMALWKIALLLFWTLWLLYAYLRYGQKPWKRSLLWRCIRFFGTKELKLDIQKKMIVRISRPVYLLIAGVVLGIGGYVLKSYYQWYGGAVTGIAGGMLTATAVCLLIAVALFLYNGWCQRKLARDLGLLSGQIDAAFDGRERGGRELPADSDLADLAKKVAGIQDGFEKAVEERMKSERLKVELVANVSHDIKTPLTSIVSYVDLLREDESLPEELKDYVEILAQKSERLKEMVQDVFEVSKASSGQLPVQMERLDLAKLLWQTLADMQERIEESPVSIKAQIPEEAVEVLADGQRLYRVFQNLLQNALQYSLEGSRIYVTLEKKGGLAAASVRNTSKYELDGRIDFTERFVRGDNSRTDGGSGLGLSIAKSFTEACGGTFKVETIADLFVARVEFALEEDEA